ncbi:NINE protein [Myxococcota bacterium]|nr:NINE protein [Myxococcota bacterium]MBU1431568.1 NINE protein [Myxococcota bacterium]MBU1900499.1 NINE protein [Myxococcota bacterium]
MKDKTTAGVFALVLGGIGAHHFYLGQVGRGILYLFFSWTFIPSFIAFIEGVVLLAMDQDRFDEKYNPHRQLQQPQNIVVNVAANASNSDGGGRAITSVAGEIKALHELKLAGALTEAEFEQEKHKLLSAPMGGAPKQLSASAAQVIEPPRVSLSKR